MQTIKKPKVKNQFSVVIDKSLDQYDTQILFPEKLEKANQTFRRIGFPKQFMNH